MIPYDTAGKLSLKQPSTVIHTMISYKNKANKYMFLQNIIAAHATSLLSQLILSIVD